MGIGRARANRQNLPPVSESQTPAPFGTGAAWDLSQIRPTGRPRHQLQRAQPTDAFKRGLRLNDSLSCTSSMMKWAIGGR